MGRRTKRLKRFPLLATSIAAVMVVSATVTNAQLDIIPSPTPDPTAAPEQPTPPPPERTATPSDPTPDPVPSGILPEEPIPTPTDTKTAKPTDGADDPRDDLTDLPEGLEEEFDFQVPSFARTRPRNTVKLVKILTELTEFGIPLEQALIEGMGRFPVAGLAHYFDDWLNPRFTPKPHLHKGLDIFADFGTPIRSPDSGVITQLSEGGAGGTAVWMRGQDDTSYYFAHLLERAEGIEVGDKVEIGTVLGFVGDSGNAQGGTPHLHFEIHPKGGEAVPPKPTVDAWLDEAEKIAPRWVKARRELVNRKGRNAASRTGLGKRNEEIEASLLLTLLDPVGGSVGLLPSLDLRPRRGGAVSDRLLSELIRQRVAGHLFVPSSRSHLLD